MVTHLLVVDDSFLERRRIGHLLQRGFPDAVVTFASNGCLAIDSLAEVTPDLIISDMRMPEMNGLQLVKTLRAAENHVPVILMTGFGSETIAVDALLAGASSYVPKLELERNLIPTIHDLMAIAVKQENRRRVLSTLSASEFRYTIENDPVLVSPLISHLLDQIVTMKLLNGQQITRVGVVLQEAVSNAIHHGNLELDSELRQEDESVYYSLAAVRRQREPYAGRQVRVLASLSREEVRFTVADDGNGFDFEKLFDPAAEVHLDRIGGRGLLLIRSFMDEVSFNERGNEITMALRATCSESDPMNRTIRHFEMGSNPARPTGLHASQITVLSSS